MPRILFIGDIVGRPGRSFVLRVLSNIKESLSLDIVIANAENAAGGAGVTSAICKDLLAVGIDAITLGDHVWDQRGFAEEIDGLAQVCRPANLPSIAPGRTHLIVEFKGFRLAVFTVLGTAFMKKKVDCPFRTCDRLLDALKNDADAFVVEIHAEATAEKVALGRYLDGRAALVVGTHTHVPTADACILPNGTAYITDVGMTGPFDSVIGVKTDIIVSQFLDSIPRRYEIAKNDVRLCGCLVTLEDTTHLVQKLDPICINDKESK